MFRLCQAIGGSKCLDVADREPTPGLAAPTIDADLALPVPVLEAPDFDCRLHEDLLSPSGVEAARGIREAKG